MNECKESNLSYTVYCILYTVYCVYLGEYDVMGKGEGGESEV
jgi:hypothetical protein